MKTRYIADDGTSFDTKEECQRYERENALSDYEKEWGEHISLKERARKVRAYWKAQSNRGLSDDYLASVDKITRATDIRGIAGEFGYGIIYMRDDAVEILLKYIERLEHGEDGRETN
ncbi:hypothetical protein [Selenomonas ruminantium]|uniref:hypothetical protein n=1 Tax=Selenomonas ruminantium TaxID=971 RepID=UPI0026EEA4C0|nr:hypothetical protein [Selenomonas ruminantium]